MEGIQYTPDTSLDPTASAALGVWQNLQVILGQQVQRYIQAINTKNKNGKRGVSISDINGLLSFLEETINNTLSVSLKQKISISKLRTSQPKLAENEDKRKQRIRINESQLRRIVSESVKKALREMNENREIFTLDVFDLTNDEAKDDFQVTSRIYYDLDEAILAAQTAAREYSEDDDVIEVDVMRGEYENPNGEIYGEPDVIFTASNKDKRSTAIARGKAGYTSLKVDFYAL